MTLATVVLSVLWVAQFDSLFSQLCWADPGETVAAGEEDWLTGVLRGPLCDNGNIQSISVSPTLAVVTAVGRKGRSSDGLLKLYDAHTGEILVSRLATKQNHGEFLSIAFAPDGTTLATSHRAGGVTFWKLDEIEGNDSQITMAQTGAFPLPSSGGNLCFSPDGALLAVGCVDRVIRIFRAPDGESVAGLRGHARRISAVCFSPDGKLLASAGGQDGTVKVWETQGFNEVLTLEKGTGVVTDLTFTPDGKVLVAAYGSGMPGYPDSSVQLAHPQEQLRLWNVSNARMERSFFVGGDRLNSVSLSPDGCLVAVGYTHREPSVDNSVAILDVASGERLATIRGRWRRPISRWSPSRQTLVVADGANVEMWDVESPQRPGQRWTDTWHWLDKAQVCPPLEPTRARGDP